jgi:hypothetical protein
MGFFSDAVARVVIQRDRKKTCKQECDAMFSTDPLFKEACYGYCSSRNASTVNKKDLIENYIGCETYFVKTGVIPPCDNFNPLTDTAQGQAFQAETQAGAGYVEAVKLQQEAINTANQTNQDVVKKAAILLGVVMLAMIAYLFMQKDTE